MPKIEDTGYTECATDADCSAFECVEDQTLFSDAPELTWNQCRGKSCGTNADCKDGYHCIPFVNGADYFDVRYSIPQAIYEQFAKDGIEIPFQQIVVHNAK